MYTIEQNDRDLIATTAAIRYRLSFPRAGSHLMDVRMEVDRPGETVVVSLPNWIPGSYKIRDFVTNQGNVSALDQSGNELTFEWIERNRLRVDTRGVDTLHVSYVYYGNERSVRMTHVSRAHAFVNPANALMMVEGRTDEIHHVHIDAPWSVVSTALSPVAVGVWGALNYDILVDSPIEIGNHFVARYERHGAMHEVAITGTGDHDADWIVERTKTIVDQGVAMWGDLPYDRYVFIIQLLPGEYGGLEHARSSVNMFDSLCFNDPEKVVGLLTLLCHEYFHLWNVKRIRPVELGPFDYQRENYTRMLWLAEGITSYYDDMMTYRCGFVDRSGLLKNLAELHLAKLLEVPGRNVMSVKDSSYLSWVKLYVPTPDSQNRFPSYYLKGGIVFLLLDMHIIAETEGDRSLDDGMRGLWRRYMRNPSVGLTEEEFIEEVSSATGVNVGSMLLPWLSTTAELPIADVMSRLGLAWRTSVDDGSEMAFGDQTPRHPSPPSDRWIGLTTEGNGKGLFVARVWSESPAEEAGIGAGDEIIAVNGVRVASQKDFDAALRASGRSETIALLCSSERSLYQTTLHVARKENYELIALDDVGDVERRCRERWLLRSEAFETGVGAVDTGRGTE